MEETIPDTQSGHPFLNLANQGKTHWGIYLLGFFVMGCIWFLGGGLFIAIFFDHDQLSELTISEPFSGSNPFADLIALSLTFLALIIGIWVAVCRIHRRPFISLITPYPTIRWTRFWQAFGWQIALIIVAACIEELLYPNTYAYTLDPERFYKFAILVVLFIPFQAASEELLFRGYILQAIGHLTQKPIILILLNGLGFMALHFANPEISEGWPAWLAYFAWGFFLTLITLKDNGAELAFGMHIANNMFAGIFANYKDSALPTNAVFTAQEIHAWYGLISYILSSVVLYWIFFRNGEPDPIPEKPAEYPINAPVEPLEEADRNKA